MKKDGTHEGRNWTGNCLPGGLDKPLPAAGQHDIIIYLHDLVKCLNFLRQAIPQQIIVGLAQGLNVKGAMIVAQTCSDFRGIDQLLFPVLVLPGDIRPLFQPGEHLRDGAGSNEEVIRDFRGGDAWFLIDIIQNMYFTHRHQHAVSVIAEGLLVIREQHIEAIEDIGPLQQFFSVESGNIQI